MYNICTTNQYLQLETQLIEWVVLGIILCPGLLLHNLLTMLHGLMVSSTLKNRESREKSWKKLLMESSVKLGQQMIELKEFQHCWGLCSTCCCHCKYCVQPDPEPYENYLYCSFNKVYNLWRYVLRHPILSNMHLLSIHLSNTAGLWATLNVSVFLVVLFLLLQLVVAQAITAIFYFINLQFFCRKSFYDHSLHGSYFYYVYSWHISVIQFGEINIVG